MGFILMMAIPLFVVWIFAHVKLGSKFLGLVVAGFIGVALYAHNAPKPESKDVYKTVFNVDEDQMNKQMKADHDKLAKEAEKTAQKHNESLQEAKKNGAIPNLKDTNNKSSWEILNSNN